MLDEAGFDGMTDVGSHDLSAAICSRPTRIRRAGVPPWPPETAWPDAWVLTGAMAAVTTRPAVLQRGLHRPGAAAAGGGQAGGHRGGPRPRAGSSLAVGAGWMREEYELMGQDFHNRGRRLDEMIPALRALWRGGWVSWSGEHYQVPEMMIEPHPPAPVPIMCGGESEAALRRAARLCDGWVGYAYRWDDAVRYVDAAHRTAPRVRPPGRTLRDPAGADGTADRRAVPARRGRRDHRGDVRAVDGRGPSRRRRRRALPRADRAVRRDGHRQGET